MWFIIMIIQKFTNIYCENLNNAKVGEGVKNVADR